MTMSLPGGSDGKESACNAGDMSLIPRLERYPGEGNNYPLRYSCLEHSMDKRDRWATVHGVTESQTRLGHFHQWQSLLQGGFLLLHKTSDYDWVHILTQTPFSSVQFSLVAQSCLTLCNIMNRSMPGLPVNQQLLEFTQAHIHWVGDAIHPAISSSVIPFSSCPQSLPASESFPMSQPFPWGGQSTGVLASASFLPKKSQGWSPSEWTGWISLQSKGLSRVFSNTTVKSINSSVLSFLHSPTLTSIHDHWKNHSLD